MALGGVALVSGATPGGDAIGVLLALTAGAGWAGYILAVRRAGSFPDFLDTLTVAILASAIVALPVAVVAALRFPIGSVLALLALVALLGRIVPYGLELVALSRLNAHAAGILFSGEPAIAAAVGAIVLGQGMSPLRALGILAVVGAGALVLGGSPAEPRATRSESAPTTGEASDISH
jgi:inner membrane transporter RhtA